MTREKRRLEIVHDGSCRATPMGTITLEAKDADGNVGDGRRGEPGGDALAGRLELASHLPVG